MVYMEFKSMKKFAAIWLWLLFAWCGTQAYQSDPVLRMTLATSQEKKAIRLKMPNGSLSCGCTVSEPSRS
jgi:hypothetical protein